MKVKIILLWFLGYGTALHTMNYRVDCTDASVYISESEFKTLCYYSRAFDRLSAKRPDNIKLNISKAHFDIICALFHNNYNILKALRLEEIIAILNNLNALCCKKTILKDIIRECIKNLGINDNNFVIIYSVFNGDYSVLKELNFEEIISIFKDLDLLECKEVMQKCVRVLGIDKDNLNIIDALHNNDYEILKKLSWKKSIDVIRDLDQLRCDAQFTSKVTELCATHLGITRRNFDIISLLFTDGYPLLKNLHWKRNLSILKDLYYLQCDHQLLAAIAKLCAAQYRNAVKGKTRGLLNIKEFQDYPAVLQKLVGTSIIEQFPQLLQKLVNFYKKQENISYHCHYNPSYIISAFDTSQDGNVAVIAYATQSGKEVSVLHWDITKDQPRFLSNVKGNVGVIKISKDSSLVLIGSKQPELWDIASEVPKKTLSLPIHSDSVTAADISLDNKDKDNNLVMTGGGNHYAGIWHVESGKMKCVLRHSGPIIATFFSDNQLMAYTAAGSAITIWNIMDKRPTTLKVFEATSPLLSMVVTDNGRYIWSTKEDHNQVTKRDLEYDKCQSVRLNDKPEAPLFISSATKDGNVILQEGGSKRISIVDLHHAYIPYWYTIESSDGDSSAQLNATQMPLLAKLNYDGKALFVVQPEPNAGYIGIYNFNKAFEVSSYVKDTIDMNKAFLLVQWYTDLQRGYQPAETVALIQDILPKDIQIGLDAIAQKRLKKLKNRS